MINDRNKKPGKKTLFHGIKNAQSMDEIMPKKGRFKMKGGNRARKSRTKKSQSQ